MTAKRIMIVAGGTGGHVFPGLAVARRIQEAGVEVVWLGTRKGLEAHLVPPTGIPIHWISISALRGKGMLTLLLAPIRLLIALSQAGAAIMRLKPQAVLGMGGFVSGPGGLMAWLLRRPLFIHEQNARAGLTNRLLAPLAKTVFSAFPGAFDADRANIVVGNPVREEISRLPKPVERLPHEDRRARLLVIGGSLGAKVLNNFVPEALALIEESERPEVRHQAGTRTIAEARCAYERTEIEHDLVPFIDDMAEAYGWADIVICRAGALTVSEIAAAGIASILVPIPHAVDDHQTANARYLADAHAAFLIPQHELTAERLADALRVLMTERLDRLQMADRARSLAMIDADRKVASACLEAVGVAA